MKNKGIRRTKESEVKEVEEVANSGHKSNWLTILKNHFVDIKGAGWTNENLKSIQDVTALIPDLGAMTSIGQEATVALLTSSRLAFAGTVTGIVAAPKFQVLGLAGFGNDYFKGYWAYVVWDAGGAGDQPQGQFLECTGYVSVGGDFTVAAFVPNVIVVGDKVLLVHPSLAYMLGLTPTRAGYLDNLSGGAVALEATLTAIKGVGWGTETLVAIMAAIGTIAGVNTYQEEIPDTDFNLIAIINTLVTDPPGAPAVNSVVDIDQVGGSTFVLRSLWVNVTNFGTTGGTKLIFKLWVMLNAVVTMVDSVDVASLGIQNLVDIFGLQEVHADGIWITVQTDATDDPGDAKCKGTYRYAKAS